MKTLILLVILLLWHGGRTSAQPSMVSETIEGYQLTLKNITFDTTSGYEYPIPLRQFGLVKFNYSVLINVQLEGQEESEHLPGQLSNGDKFDFRLKVGNELSGDTLYIIRQTGEIPLCLSKVKIMAFRGRNRSGVIPNNREFRAFLLKNYNTSTISNTDYFTLRK